jgi:hypothetical protein
MARKKKDQPPKVETKTFTVKKCPYCYTYVAVKEMRCKNCGKRIGTVDSSGWARKVFDFRAYSGAIIAIAIFLAFYWWAYLRE